MNKTTTIIGISGASGAGKSVLARHLYKRLTADHSPNHASILHEDSYYRDRSDLSFEVRELINYDHPDALEHELLVEHLKELRAGRAVEVPQYDYATHNRCPDTVQLVPVPVLILEGILILHDPRVREQLDLKIFVDVPLDICLTRRLRRDTQQRGRTVDSVLTQYENTVRPMYHQFIEPSTAHADLIVPRGGENETALHVLHNYLGRLLANPSASGS